MSHKENCNCNDGSCHCRHDGGCGSGSGCDCGCCDCRCFHRRFQTKAEQRQELESYLAELKLEIQAVEERLADLGK